MSITSYQRTASTTLDARDVATLVAALTLYLADRSELGGKVPLHLLEMASSQGAHEPLTHQETQELLDILQNADVVESTTLDYFFEYRQDGEAALGMHLDVATERAQAVQVDIPIV